MTRFQIRKVLRKIFNKLSNFKWHMPIWGKICRAQQKYMPFFGAITQRHIRKKIQSTEAYTNDATLRSGFSTKHARWWSRVLDFFQDSRVLVRVNYTYCDILNFQYTFSTQSMYSVTLVKKPISVHKLDNDCISFLRPVAKCDKIFFLRSPSLLPRVEYQMYGNYRGAVPPMYDRI